MAKQKKEAYTTELTTELIAKAKAGDPKAKNHLGAWARNFIRSKIRISSRRTRDTRSDVTQEIVTEIMCQLNEFYDSSPEAFQVWISTKTFRRTVDSIREAGAKRRDIKKDVKLSNDLADSHSNATKSPSQMVSDMEMSRIAMGILWDPEQMPEDQRKVIILRIIRQVSVAEVARRMGKTEAWVDSTFRRAMIKLRRLYAAGVGETPGKTTSAASSHSAAAFVAYVRQLDTGKPVNIDAFLREVESTDEELRAILHLIEDLRTGGFDGDDGDDGEDDQDT